MNKKILVLVPFLLLTVGCNTKKETPTSIDSGTSFDSSESINSDESSSSEPIYTLFDKVFTFKDGIYANKNFGIDDTDANKAAFLDNLNTEAGTEMFTSLSVEKCFFNIYGEETNKYTMVVGSQKALGKMTLNSSYDIVKVKASVQAYNKYISYNDSWSIDPEVEFSLMDETFDLSDTIKENEAPEIVTKEVNVGHTNKLTINGLSGRFFLHQLTVTYRILGCA